MITRARAAKRPADEDISTSPAKSPRTNSASPDGASPGRREEAKGRQRVRRHHRKDVSTGSDESKEAAPRSDADQSINPPLHAADQVPAKDEAAHEAVAPAASKQPTQSLHAQAAGPGDASSEALAAQQDFAGESESRAGRVSASAADESASAQMLAESSSARNKPDDGGTENDKYDRPVKAADSDVSDDVKHAIDVMMQFLALFERNKALEEGTTLMHAQHQDLIRLCELVAHPLARDNQSLVEWFSWRVIIDMRTLHETVTAAEETRQALDDLEIEVTRTDSAHKDALTQKLLVVMNKPGRDTSEEARSQHADAVEKALHELKAAREARNRSKALYETQCRQVQDRCNDYFEKVEPTLVEWDLIDSESEDGGAESGGGDGWEHLPEEQRHAIEVVAQIVLLIERSRVLEEGATLMSADPEEVRILGRIAALCDSESNQWIREWLPPRCIEDINELVDKDVRAATRAREALDSTNREVEKASAAHMKALWSRSVIVVEETGGEPKFDRFQMDIEVDAGLSSLERARARASNGMALYNRQCRLVQDRLERIFRAAAPRLISNGQMQSESRRAKQPMQWSSSGPSNNDYGSSQLPDGREPLAADGRSRRETTAVQLMIQFIFLMKRNKCLEEGKTLMSAHEQGMVEVCNLARRYFRDSNRYGSWLPPNFREDMRDVQWAVREAIELKEALDDLGAEVVRRSTAYNDAINERLMHVFQVPGRDQSVEAGTAKEDAMDQALQVFESARKAESRTRDLYDSQCRKVGALWHKLERTIMPGLVQQFIVRPQSGVPRAQQQGPSNASQGAKERRETGAAQPGRDAPREMPSGQRESRARRDHDDPARPSIADTMAREQLRLLRARSRELNAAKDEFNRVRDRYHQTLYDFLKKRAQGHTQDTQTDFDLAYYRARGQANADFGRAWEAYRDALEVADQMDILNKDDRINLLGDYGSSASGRSGVGGDGDGDGDDDDDDDAGGRRGGRPRHRDYIREARNEQVERWRQDPGMREVMSESHWEGMVPDDWQDGESVGGFSEIELKHSLQKGRGRRRIDQWEAQMAKLRKGFEGDFARWRAMEAEDRLPWWQVWDGVR